MTKVRVTGIADVSEEEIQKYVKYAEDKYGSQLEELLIDVQEDNVNLSYVLRQPSFERVRRITGYLVGTLDKWNDAKRAEERDRVKHGA